MVKLVKLGHSLKHGKLVKFAKPDQSLKHGKLVKLGKLIGKTATSRHSGSQICYFLLRFIFIVFFYVMLLLFIPDHLEHYDNRQHFVIFSDSCWYKVMAVDEENNILTPAEFER